VSDIAIAVEAEINVLERRLVTLREIKRLALELDADRLPRAAVRDKPAARKPEKNRNGDRSKIPPRLTPEGVIDTARDLLADGPVTSAEIHRALDRWPTPRTRAIVEDVVTQLGAVPMGKVKGGAVRWGLPADPTTAVSTKLDRHELELRIGELEDKFGEWSPEEWQYQLHERQGLADPHASAVKDHEQTPQAQRGQLRLAAVAQRPAVLEHECELLGPDRLGRELPAPVGVVPARQRNDGRGQGLSVESCHGDETSVARGWDRWRGLSPSLYGVEQPSPHVALWGQIGR
jgi:hypothetical protein